MASLPQIQQTLTERLKRSAFGGYKLKKVRLFTHSTSLYLIFLGWLSQIQESAFPIRWRTSKTHRRERRKGASIGRVDQTKSCVGRAWRRTPLSNWGCKEGNFGWKDKNTQRDPTWQGHDDRCDYGVRNSCQKRARGFDQWSTRSGRADFRTQGTVLISLKP